MPGLILIGHFYSVDSLLECCATWLATIHSFLANIFSPVAVQSVLIRPVTSLGLASLPVSSPSTNLPFKKAFMFSGNLTDSRAAFQDYPNDTGLSALTATDEEDEKEAA